MKTDQIPKKLLESLGYGDSVGSMQDRLEKEAIDLKEGVQIEEDDSIIVEPVYEDSDIGLAALAASNGYKIIVAVPETISSEQRFLLQSYGAMFIQITGKDEMKRAMQKAEELARSKENKGKIIVVVFPELEEDYIMDERVDE